MFVELEGKGLQQYNTPFVKPFIISKRKQAQLSSDKPQFWLGFRLMISDNIPEKIRLLVQELVKGGGRGLGGVTGEEGMGSQKFLS